MDGAWTVETPTLGFKRCNFDLQNMRKRFSSVFHIIIWFCSNYK